MRILADENFPKGMISLLLKERPRCYFGPNRGGWVDGY